MQVYRIKRKQKHYDLHHSAYAWLPLMDVFRTAELDEGYAHLITEEIHNI